MTKTASDLTCGEWLEGLTEALTEAWMTTNPSHLSGLLQAARSIALYLPVDVQVNPKGGFIVVPKEF